jgi:hypothetical protein
MDEATNGVTPGWYINSATGLQQYWDGTSWSEIPAPTQSEGQLLVAPKSETSDLAVIAFVFSLLIPFVGWILGFKARKEIAASQGKKSGGPLATAAIWIGGIVTVGVAAMIALCALTSIAFDHHFDNRYDDRGFRNHMFGQDGRDDFGGMMNSDGSGSITITPRGGMMFGDQGNPDYSTGTAVPESPSTT